MSDTVTLDPVQETIAKAIGRIASGVYIITSQADPTGKVGMLGSWVMQAGFEPPTVSVALHPDREVYKAIQASKRFSIQVISETNKSLMKSFYKYSPTQFETVTHELSSDGIVLQEAIATMHCLLTQSIPAGDHHIVLGQVISAVTQNIDHSPMIHLRQSGFHY